MEHVEPAVLILTTVQWLSYIAQYMLTSCELKAPKAAATRTTKSGAPTKAALEKQREVAARDTLLQAQEVMRAALAATSPPAAPSGKRSGTRAGARSGPSKGVVHELPERSADGLVSWARGKGWVA